MTQDLTRPSATLAELELRLQDEATWRVLEVAARQREFLYQLHGAAVVVLPAIIPAFLRLLENYGPVVRGTAALLTVDLAAALLLFLSEQTLETIEDLRMQQFALDAAANHSRRQLAAGHAPSFFTRPNSNSGVVPLSQQNDPMGFTLRASVHLLLIDAIAVAILLGTTVAATVAFVAGVSLLAPVGPPVFATGLSVLVGAGLIGWAVSRRIARAIAQSERRTAEAIDRRLRELGAIAP